MKQKTANSGLKKDATYVFIGYFSRYLYLFILIPFYGRVLGPSGYGEVLAAMSLMNIVWLLVGFGFSMPGIRALASTTSPADHGQILTRQLAARILIVPIGVVVGVAGTLLSPVLAAHPGLGFVATAIGVLNAFNLGWLFQGIQRFRVSIAIEILSFPVTLVLILLMVDGPDDSLQALLAMLISSIVCTATAYAVGLRLVAPRRIAPGDPIGEIRASTVFFVQSLSAALLANGSTYLLSIYASPSEVGHYGAAERLLSLALSALGPAGQLLMPTITRARAAEGDHAFRLASWAIVLEIGYGMAAALAIIVLSPYAVPVILGPGFEQTVDLLYIMAGIPIFYGLFHSLSLYKFVPSHREKYVTVCALVASSTSLGAGAAAAAVWGADGMAFARLGGEFVGALLITSFALVIGRAILRRENIRREKLWNVAAQLVRDVMGLVRLQRGG